MPSELRTNILSKLKATGAAEIHLPHSGTYRDFIGGGVYNGENGTLLLPRKSIRAYLLAKENGAE